MRRPLLVYIFKRFKVVGFTNVPEGYMDWQSSKKE
jgi:hypothetical protein